METKAREESESSDGTTIIKIQWQVDRILEDQYRSRPEFEKL